MDPVIIQKLILGFGIATFGALLCRSRFLHSISRSEFHFLALVLTLLSRLGLFFVFYVILEQDVPSDVASYYRPAAKNVLSGLAPYRDFDTRYAPLFPYLGAVLTLLWNSPKVFVLFAMLVELLSLPLWLSVARKTLSEAATRNATVLYLSNGAVLINVCVGQNQIWISLFNAGTVWLLLNGQSLLSGLLQGLSLVVVKALSAMFAPAVWLASDRRTWLFGFLLFPLAVYGGFCAAGIDVFFPLKQEAALISSGNIPFLVTLLGLDASGVVGRTSVYVLFLLWGVTLAREFHSTKTEGRARILYLMTFFFLSFMLLSKKSYTSYLAMSLFPLCLTLTSASMGARGLALYGLFGTTAAVEPSMWFRCLNQHDFRVLGNGPPIFAPRALDIVLFLCLELVLLSCYACYLYVALRKLYPQRGT